MTGRRWRAMVEAELAGPLLALSEAGGPAGAPTPLIEAVVDTAHHIAEEARLDPAGLDEVVDAVVALGDREVDALIAPWEAEPPPDGDPDALLSAVVALKRSVRLAVFSIDAHMRHVFRRRSVERGRVLREFGRTLAHEIKNRLGAAETALMLLDTFPEEGNGTSASTERIYSLVAGSLEAAHRSVDDVRSLAMYRDHTMFPTTRPERLEEVVRRAVRDVRMDADARRVRIEFDNLPDMRVDGGPAGLVLTNLVGNAVKYSDSERDDAWVRVSGTETAACVEITVEDNGVGIPVEHHQRIFEQSVRVAADGDGSGLGLTIVRDALRQLGGDLELDSEPGRGTRITVSFPRRNPGADVE